MADMHEIVEAWKPYIDSIDNWETLVAGIEPKPTGCGPVYELANPIDRPNESFAVADMRDIEVAEPHYHVNSETEIYFVLQGLGLVVVGGKESEVQKGSVVVTPPDTAHFTIPGKKLVLAVVNTPPFKAENYVVVEESNVDVGFSREQLDNLIAQRQE